MKKQIEFAAKFDTSDFDKSVESMQKKLKELYAPSDMVRAQSMTAQRMQGAGMPGMMSQPGTDAYAKATQQSRRELDQLIAEQARGQEKLGKQIADRNNKLKEMQKLQADLVKGSREELEVKEKISRIEENNARMRQIYMQRDAALNQAIDSKEKTSGKSISDYGQMPKDFADAMGNFGGGRKKPSLGAMAGGVGAGAGAIGAILTGLAKINDAYTGYPMRLEQARGSAVQNTVGQDLGKVYGGKSAFEQMYMGERSQAAGIAADRASSNRTNDRMKGLGMGAAVVAGAAGLVAAPFTGGLSLGLTAAGLGAAGIGAGMYGLASNDRARKGVFGGKEYDQLIASQQAKDFRETYENLKDQDPLKKMTMENFEQNYMKNVGIQRTLGINNKGFYGEGGLLQRGAQSGFMPDQMMGMAQGIVGAGGSARMGRNAEFGLQMERGGLTNASNLLGTLSGSIQAPESNKRAMVSIISEAFQVGLDNTDFAEEQRRFTQAAASAVAKSGATGEDDQTRIIQSLGMFLGDRSNAGVGAAQGAYERYQERGSQVGGRRGALRMVDALQDKNLRNIPMQELGELLRMNPDQFQETSEVTQYAAKKAGLSPKDFISRMQKGRDDNRFMIPGSKEAVAGSQKTIKDYLDKNGLQYSQLGELQDQGKLPSEISEAFGQMELRNQMEEKGGLNKFSARAMGGEFFQGGAISGASRDATGKLLSVGDRIEDKANAAGAQGADKLRDQFTLLIPELEKAVVNMKEFSKGAAEAGQALHDSATVRRTTAPQGDALGRDMYKPLIGPTTQPQGGKSSK